MKAVRLVDNVVFEVIPDYAIPVFDWYGAKFASQCVEAPDNVEQGWIRKKGEFYAPDLESEQVGD